MYGHTSGLIQARDTVLSGVLSRINFYGRVTLRDDHLTVGGSSLFVKCFRDLFYFLGNLQRIHKVTSCHAMRYGHSGHVAATNERVGNVSHLGSDLQ